MATKKKGAKKKKSQRAAAKKTKVAKRVTKKIEAKKMKASKKPPAQVKKKSAAGRSAKEGSKAGRRSSPKKNRIYDTQDGALFAPEAAGLRAGGQAGDLQGLPDTESSDAESVDELLEEGNAFEADVVAGVERADNDDDPREVRTHEVPEDDVPEEYLDKD
jgi:hypothetical protein